MVWGFLLSLLLEVKIVERDFLGHISLVLNDGWWLLKKVPQVAQIEGPIWAMPEYYQFFLLNASPICKTSII